MKNYLIIWDEDWADEFNIFGYEMLFESELNELIKAIESMPEEERKEEEEFYFGTNEYLYLSYDEILAKLLEASLLTDEEYSIIIKFFCYRNRGQYFLDVVHDQLMERGYLKEEIC